MYSATEVARLLDYEGCIAAVRSAMEELSVGGRAQPLRAITPISEGNLFAIMPGIGAHDTGFGGKVISVFREPGDSGRSRHQGLVMLFDTVTGEPLCVADAHEITKIRTACASAVATDALARADATTLGILGCGTQAESHVLALPLVRPIDKIVVWGRSPEKAKAFAGRMREQAGLDVQAVPDAQTLAAAADVICTVTSAVEPILRNDWLRPGTHVNAVGSSYAGPVEIDTEVVANSRYFVDYLPSALAAAAEFIKAKEAGVIGDEHIAGEIGEIIAGLRAGRTDPDEVTVYKSLGHIVQDLAATRYVHERAAGSR